MHFSVSDQELLKKLALTNWSYFQEIIDFLSPYDKKFIEIEFTQNKTIDYYKNRLSNLNLINLDSILDAGCGMGQWSLAMSHLNKNIFGIDVCTQRLFIANHLAKSTQTKNCHFQYSPIEKTIFESQSMDAIFCYGVLTFTSIPRSIAEFGRLLKKGGLLYINYNALGWYLHTFFQKGLKNKNIKEIKESLKYFYRTLVRKRYRRIFTFREISKLLNNSGFTIEQSGCEGSINLINSKQHIEPAYQSTYLGYPLITELICKKN